MMSIVRVAVFLDQARSRAGRRVAANRARPKRRVDEHLPQPESVPASFAPVLVPGERVAASADDRPPRRLELQHKSRVVEAR